MKVVDFLCGLLEAHAETLKYLAGVLGEEGLIEALEEMDDAPPLSFEAVDVSPIPSAVRENLYLRLENAVSDSGLPKVLQFYLWAYPPYRHWIEGLGNLDSTLTQEDAARAVEASVAEALRWRSSLLSRLPQTRFPQTDQMVSVMGSPWLRLRTRVLQSVGMRHVG